MYIPKSEFIEENRENKTEDRVIRDEKLLLAWKFESRRAVKVFEEDTETTMGQKKPKEFESRPKIPIYK